MLQDEAVRELLGALAAGAVDGADAAAEVIAGPAAATLLGMLSVCVCVAEFVRIPPIGEGA